jgi:hypothetical protein
MEPRQEQPTIDSAQQQGARKKPRFQILKLEERIAPGGGGPTNKPHPCAGSVGVCTATCRPGNCD